MGYRIVRVSQKQTGGWGVGLGVGGEGAPIGALALLGSIEKTEDATHHRTLVSASVATNKVTDPAGGGRLGTGRGTPDESESQHDNTDDKTAGDGNLLVAAGCCGSDWAHGDLHFLTVIEGGSSSLTVGLASESRRTEAKQKCSTGRTEAKGSPIGRSPRGRIVEERRAKPSALDMTPES
jgi:hypothetical protein